MSSTPAQPPITLTNKVKYPGADIAALGDQEVLAAAFESRTPVTLSGQNKYAGEIVHLGHRVKNTAGGYDIVGLDKVWGESPNFPGHTIVAYLVDLTRLEQAPQLAELIRKVNADRLARYIKAEERAEAEDARLENLAEDGA